MPRGVTPRRPARTGRQDKVHVARTLMSAKASQKRYVKGKNAAANGRGSPSPAAGAKVAKASKGYNPLAPERIGKILKGLDELYPAVTCALTHSSAWELLVATILSAQSTD